MNWKQAKLLDILLKDFTIIKYKGNGYTTVEKVKKGNKHLNKLSNLEIDKLLFIIKKEQLKLPKPMLSGDISIFLANEYTINEFLNSGGFKKIFWKNIWELYLKRLVQLIAIISFIKLVIFGLNKYISQSEKIEDDKSSPQQSEKKQTKVLKDSSDIHYHKSNLINQEYDSLKVQ
ncbi:hypothetical protein SAMN06265371_106238 [Lutibacter agarilyticus]|uniref:Uncharacterized protein n=1 Tax=Lutibacter agarilyticus TaxID=1109740 RepID=A0A238XR84_9FLAO|nr:hypothetical protein [Lutibacter agarilyticus]SNR61088.1 hypothetical protein SAMN06265371_106238 [Lutibacter agarilyticus]